MNRIASRAWVTVLIALLLVAGLGFFLAEFVVEGGDWAVFSGSPHVYTDGRATATLVDRNGEVLVDMSGERTYSQELSIRKSTLHWVGDRDGYIYTPFYDHYAKALSGFDVLNGVYRYGENTPEMTLTWDARVQAAALEALGSYHGTVSVYNYKTGALLCAVTTPTYDPDDPPDVEADEDGAYKGVYVNRFTQSAYIPGSIFKIVTLAAALETIPDIREQSFYCESVYEIDGEEVTCEGWHGWQDIEDAFANSCNCAFAQIVEQLGAETLTSYVEKFQVTDSFTFDGIETEKGNFDIGGAAALNVAWAGIGQYTDQVNPYAYLSFMGAIAGEGCGVQPYVVSQVAVGKEVTYQASPVTRERIMSRETARQLREYLGYNVEQVYGSYNFPGLTVCAKSGTGELGEGLRPNATFAGFVTDDAYPLAFFVAVEEAGYGSQICVPILSQVLSACVEAMDGG